MHAYRERTTGAWVSGYVQMRDGVRRNDSEIRSGELRERQAGRQGRRGDEKSEPGECSKKSRKNRGRIPQGRYGDSPLWILKKNTFTKNTKKTIKTRWGNSRPIGKQEKRYRGEKWSGPDGLVRGPGAEEKKLYRGSACPAKDQRAIPTSRGSLFQRDRDNQKFDSKNCSHKKGPWPDGRAGTGKTCT